MSWVNSVLRQFLANGPQINHRWLDPQDTNPAIASKPGRQVLSSSLSLLGIGWPFLFIMKGAYNRPSMPKREEKGKDINSLGHNLSLSNDPRLGLKEGTSQGS